MLLCIYMHLYIKYGGKTCLFVEFLIRLCARYKIASPSGDNFIEGDHPKRAFDLGYELILKSTLSLSPPRLPLPLVCAMGFIPWEEGLGRGSHHTS